MDHQIDCLVVGAGPAGLLAALQLARNGARCTLVERNHDVTQWPKMDLTNCRSMELLRRLGVAEGWKDIGVPREHSLDVIFSTGLADGGESFAKWALPSPQKWQARIHQQNDGSQPYEPWMRGAQNHFEAYLRRELNANPLVDVQYGMKFETLSETDDGVESHLTDHSGRAHTIRSRYLVGCDGGGSRVRRSLGIEMTGGPVPGAMYLIHFKSRDLSKLHRQGRFWHMFFTSGSVLISQDERDTWTLHKPIAPDADVSQISPIEAISKGLGGSLGHLVPLKIDQILVSSTWRPHIRLATRYTSQKGRVFLVGDSAHQTIPTGGYGMNTAVGDSFDIGWKLAAVLKGYAGPALLASYEDERRPVAVQNIEHSEKHWNIHRTWQEWVLQTGSDVCSQSKEGSEIRERIKRYVQANQFENQDFGIELDYRYTRSPVITSDEEGQEPTWNRSSYTPSTWPGSRVPSVWLKDGKRNIFELLGSGPSFTLVDFTTDANYALVFANEAKQLAIPLKTICLPEECHVREIWERDAILVRPDDHVAWRAKRKISEKPSTAQVGQILKKAIGCLEYQDRQTSNGDS